MVAEADLAAYDRVRLDDCAARNARLRRDDDALADPHVVADLHEVVKLRPAPDSRLAQSAAVNTRVRADLNVVFDDDRSDLRELVVDARLVAHVAEPVRADDHARVQHHTVAERHAFVQDHVRVQHAPAPHADALADDRARKNLRALAYQRALADDDTRADVHAVTYLRARRHARRRMNERVASARRVQRLCDEREGELRSRRLNRAPRPFEARAFGGDHARRAARARGVEELLVLDESYVALSRALD